MIESKVKNELEKVLYSGDFRFLLFPISSVGNEYGGADHWTSLVLDFFEKKWTFYNSYLPRQGKYLFLTEAYIMVRFVKTKQQFMNSI